MQRPTQPSPPPAANGPKPPAARLNSAFANVVAAAVESKVNAELTQKLDSVLKTDPAPNAGATNGPTVDTDATAPPTESAAPTPVAKQGDEEDDAHQDNVPVFTIEVEASLSEVVPSIDPLDAPNFDPIAYINSVFPDEKSLSGTKHTRTAMLPAAPSSAAATAANGAAPAATDGENKEKESTEKSDKPAPSQVATEITEVITLDSFVNQLYRRIVHLKDDITKSVKTHSCQRGQAKQAIVDAKSAIQELFQKIKAIKEKAKKSEDMVQEICRDIKSLDYAKKHITNTITAFRRLHMLMSAVDQLTFMTKNKQYKDSAKLLEAVTMLFQYFKSYETIAHIKALSMTVQEQKDELKMLVRRDFREFCGNPVSSNDSMVKTLSEACAVVDVLGDDVKAELLGWFLSHQLDAYRQLFGPNKEAWGLDQAERRYAWLRRKLKEYEDTFESVFPKSWAVPCMLARDFSKLTRLHFNKLFSLSTEGTKAANIAPQDDVELILKMLQKTMEFEKEMSTKFREHLEPSKKNAKKKKEDGKEEAPAEKKQVDPTLDLNFKFEGLISDAFMTQLGGYVDLERSKMRELCDKLQREERWTIDAPEPRARLTGSDELFIYIKKSMQRAAKLNTGAIFFNIYKEYQRGLLLYVDLLESKLPRRPNDANITELNASELRTCCLIINTAEYCKDTLDQLAESVQKLVDQQYKEQIDLSPQQEAFAVLITKAVQVQVGGLMARLNRIFAQMIRMPWGTWSNVGDTSDYIVAINGILHDEAPTVTQMLSEVYHQYYCTQLASRIIPAFEDAIFKCRRVNEEGSQQMSLDAHALRVILMEVPSIGMHSDEDTGATKAPRKGYVRFVTKEMTRVENILKTLSSPPDRIIQTFRALLGKDAKTGNAAEQLIKIMELRGIKKSDQQMLVDTYNNTSKPEDRIQTTGGGSFSFKNVLDSVIPLRR